MFDLLARVVDPRPARDLLRELLRGDLFRGDRDLLRHDSERLLLGGELLFLDIDRSALGLPLDRDLLVLDLDLLERDLL